MKHKSIYTNSNLISYIIEVCIKLYRSADNSLESPHIEIIFEMVFDLIRKTREESNPGRITTYVKGTTTCKTTGCSQSSELHYMVVYGLK